MGMTGHQARNHDSRVKVLGVLEFQMGFPKNRRVRVHGTFEKEITSNLPKLATSFSFKLKLHIY